MTKPKRVMYYEGSKMSFLEYVDQLEKCVEELEEQLTIHSVVSTCCGKTKAMNQFLKRPSKYCLTCGKEIQ